MGPSEAFALQLQGNAWPVAVVGFILLLVLTLSVTLLVPADEVGLLVHAVVVFCHGCHFLPVQVLFLLGVFSYLFYGAVHEHDLGYEVCVLPVL